MKGTTDSTPRAGPDERRDGRDDLLFVYGTLRRGMKMHHLLRDCRWAGPARLNGRVHDMGEYPAMRLDEVGVVEGELWECGPETLARLDAYEGVGEGLFERVRAPTAEGECWVYVAGPALRNRIGQ